MPLVALKHWMFAVETLRLFIVAEDLLVRTGLSTLLSTHDEFRLVGQSNGATITDDMEVYQPDVVLWDLGWRMENVQALSNLSLPTLVLIGDRQMTPNVLNALSNCDVFGVLLRDSQPNLLITALTTLGKNLIVIAPELSEYLSSNAQLSTEPAVELTTRETEVLQLMAQGLTNKAIAHQLGITDHTVKFHVNAIMTKLGAQSRTDAVMKANRGGLIFL
jgi:two-component system, NarL family, nitrate/nitrite response regulator NarL